MSNILNIVLSCVLSFGTAGAMITTALQNNSLEAELEEAIEVVEEPEPSTISTQEEENELPFTKNSENEKVVSGPVQPAPAVDKSTTSNATGLPDTITRYEWERQGGWAKLVEAAYFRALERGVTPMCGDGMCKTVLYYKITGVATDPCYATLEAVLEVDGETKMEIVGADLIAAPGSLCDTMRSQLITVPTLGQLTQYLRDIEAKYGLYEQIKGDSK